MIIVGDYEGLKAENKHLGEIIDELKQEREDLKTLKGKLISKQNDCSKLYMENTELENINNSLHEEIDALYEEVDHLSIVNDDLKEENKLLDCKVESINEVLDTITYGKDCITRRYEKLGNDYRNLKNEFEILEPDNAELLEENAFLQEDNKDLTDRVIELRNICEVLEAEVTMLEEDRKLLDELDKSTDVLLDKYKKLEDENINLNEDNLKLKTDLQDVFDMWDDAEQNNDLVEEIEALNGVIEDLSIEVGKLEDKLDEAERTEKFLHGLCHEQDTLIEEQGELLSEATEIVERQRGKITELSKQLADISNNQCCGNCSGQWLGGVCYCDSDCTCDCDCGNTLTDEEVEEIVAQSNFPTLEEIIESRLVGEGDYENKEEPKNNITVTFDGKVIGQVQSINPSNNYDENQAFKDFLTAISDEEKVLFKKKGDLINSPNHYTIEGLPESIELMEDKYGTFATMIFCLLNQEKYMYRKDLKGNPEQDIKKANKYLAMYKERKNKIERHNYTEGIFDNYMNLSYND